MSTDDVNHPRQLIRIWRQESDRLREILPDMPPSSGADGLIGRMNTLAMCADQLERRLKWTGLS